MASFACLLFRLSKTLLSSQMSYLPIEKVCFLLQEIYLKVSLKYLTVSRDTESFEIPAQKTNHKALKCNRKKQRISQALAFSLGINCQEEFDAVTRL